MIDRLRALEKKFKDEARVARAAFKKGGGEYHDGRSDAFDLAAGEVHDLIAELGQEVGAVAWPSERVSIADPHDPGYRIVGFKISESHPWHGKYGLSEPLNALDRAISNSPAHTSEAMDAARLVAAAKRLDKFSLVILSSVAVEDPEFSERVGAALVDLRNAAHADPCAVKYRKALERIFDCGRFPEGHHSAGDHEFCGSHHADCIAIAREALSEDAAMRQEAE